MADKIYPSKANPNANPSPGNIAPPPTKSHLVNPTRPGYRPQSRRNSTRRSCCCKFCLYLTLALITLILLAAIAGAIIYALYRPHRPEFTFNSLRLATLNLTTSSTLTSNLNFTISARNPNKKVVFYYDPIAISILSNGVSIGNGDFPSFEHKTKNTTVIKVLAQNRVQLDSGSADSLRSEMKNKALGLVVVLDTKIKAKLGGMKSPKVKVRVSCDEINVGIPSGKSTAVATISSGKCKVDTKIKVWKWTF